MSAEKYIGDELSLFEQAKNWKNYYASFIRPYLKNYILEVGAGIGSTTQHLIAQAQVSSWLCIEPDASLFAKIEQAIAQQQLPSVCKGFSGVLSELDAQLHQADAILYIDVIEHIEDDLAELLLAEKYLKPGGYLIILVPAHQYLYSPFDEAIGHYRRYSRQSLLEVLPKNLQVKKNLYLDSVGFSASWIQKKFLKQTYPKLSQIKLWDNYMIPISQIMDPILGYHFGKSILLIAQKN